MTVWRAIDTETGGVDPKEHDLLEIGWRDVVSAGSALTLGAWYEQTFVKNTKPIPLEASAVHHIVEADLAVAPERHLAVPRAVEADGFVAHKSDFELGFIPEMAGKPIVCTFRTALRLVPDAASFSNQYLRYHFGVAMSRDEREGLFPHRAGPDAYITALIFKQMLALAPIEELLRISELPPLFRRFGFGKHKGEAIGSVPADYFDWMERDGDFDEAVRHSVACERARRKDGDTEAYFALASAALDTASEEAALSDWWKAEAANRLKHHVVAKTPLYDRLVAAGAAKRAALTASMAKAA